MGQRLVEMGVCWGEKRAVFGNRSSNNILPIIHLPRSIWSFTNKETGAGPSRPVKEAKLSKGTIPLPRGLCDSLLCTAALAGRGVRTGLPLLYLQNCEYL